MMRKKMDVDGKITKLSDEAKVRELAKLAGENEAKKEFGKENVDKVEDKPATVPKLSSKNIEETQAGKDAAK